MADPNYDSDSSIEDYDVLDDLDPNAPLEFALSQHMNAKPTAVQGALRSLYKVAEDGTAIFADRTSDYSVSVDRLLWIDGYEKTEKGNSKPRREMTLVVLKMVLASLNPAAKFRHATATLKLKDSEPHGRKGPRLEAWAPFREKVKENAVTGTHAQTDKTEGGVKAGYEGAEVSGTAGREKSISWEQVYCEEGSSNEEIRKGKRVGVTWFMKQNELTQEGVKQEVWVSALFSRASSDPYLVKFNIYAYVGTAQEYTAKTKRFFGLGDGQTKAFLVTPGKTPNICNAEGHDMMRTIDPNNLGKLRDPELSTGLIIRWGPAPVPQAPNPMAAKQETLHAPREEKIIDNLAPAAAAAAAAAAVAGRSVGSVGSAGSVGEVPRSPLAQRPVQLAQTAATIGLMQSPEAHRPLDVCGSGIHDPGPRVVALEGRVAQAEARIAAQDVTILQLQRSLLELQGLLAAHLPNAAS
ncbi:hypothetical protein B0T16DRAFT_418123 [Cercophora newfieldiana]|uniref:Uncharacterized protein n=1 Tax=Cercophora newfieldiana TaxID=92897 RepID=A0AA40CK92_9PEZI|nr:hypothetical protein B0T16DRAFT_418123 [Cercophora newfieldiana]